MKGIGCFSYRKPLRDLYPDALYNHATHQVTIRGKSFNVGWIPGTVYENSTWSHYIINEKKLKQAVGGDRSDDCL